MPDRCAQNRSVIIRASTGRVAIDLSHRARRSAREPFAPRLALREAEQRAPAARTNLLVMLGSLSHIHLIGESELALDGHQIAHHHGRGIRLIASPAAGEL